MRKKWALIASRGSSSTFVARDEMKMAPSLSMVLALCFSARASAKGCPSLSVFEGLMEKSAEGRKLSMMGGMSAWVTLPEKLGRSKRDDPRKAFEERLGADALLTIEKAVRMDFLDLQSEGSNVAADYPTVCQFKTQVVAGTNYDLLVSAGDMIWEVRMFQPLPHTGEPTMITEFERITEITTWWAESE